MHDSEVVMLVWFGWTSRVGQFKDNGCRLRSFLLMIMEIVMAWLNSILKNRSNKNYGMTRSFDKTICLSHKPVKNRIRGGRVQLASQPCISDSQWKKFLRYISFFVFSLHSSYICGLLEEWQAKVVGPSYLYDKAPVDAWLIHVQTWPQIKGSHIRKPQEVNPKRQVSWSEENLAFHFPHLWSFSFSFPAYFLGR